MVARAGLKTHTVYNLRWMNLDPLNLRPASAGAPGAR